VLVLCLDTATSDIAAAAVDLNDLERTAVRIRREPRGAGEHLMPLALEALRAARHELADLAAVAVGLGPGPFTGLRAGVVTGAVLAHTLGIPAYGACSLDAYATAEPSDAFVVATDARRREVYWASYDQGARLEGPAVDLPTTVAARFAGRRIIGPGALRYADTLGGTVGDDAPFPVARLADLVADRVRAGTPTEVLVPLYLRRPDATEPAAAMGVAR
jgi:tRNA threonylcarbamoyl adenosine modification protein YeaZ